MRLSRYLAATTAIVLGVGSQHALAQSAPVAATDEASRTVDGPLDVVIVTAQKREENLQDTPIAISVLGASDIEDRHIASLVDLGDGAIPSLKVAPFFSRPGALVMNIRGIGVLSDSNQPARDQGVGVYVDGVYLGRPQGLGTALYDIESIEVLKGPQGTLFGRNTEGGAVNIVTRKPSGKFKLAAVAGAGNYGSYNSALHLDLPSMGDLSFKLDGVVTGRNGWVHNPLLGAEDFGGFEKRGYRAALLWEPSDTFSADYAYDNSYDATSTYYQQLLEPGTSRLAALTRVQSSRASEAVVGVPQPLSIGTTWGHRLTLDWDVAANITIKSISSYRDLSQGQWDNGSTPSAMFDTSSAQTGVFFNTTTGVGSGFSRMSQARFVQDQLSQEFQLIGEGDRLTYVAGVLYHEENVEDNAQAFNTMRYTNVSGSAAEVTPLNYQAQLIQRASRVKTTSQGIFGQATYTPAIMNDAFHLTVGGRWTQDEKVGQLFTVNGALPVVNGVSAARDLNKKWDRFDPMVNLSFDATQDILFYAKYSTGYKSGGANSRSLFYTPFNPETVEMMEIGAKTEFWDGRARLNLAAYSGSYNDIQLDFSAQYIQTDPVTGLTLTTLRTTTETSNAPGKGDLSGFEADFTFAATDNLTLSASYAYNKVDIPDTLNPFRQANGQLITVPIPIYPVFTPETSGSVAMDYEAPFMGVTLLAHLDANFDSGYYSSYTDVAYDSVTRAVTVAQPKGEDAMLLNGRLALADIAAGPGMATISLWSRNLLDEEHVTQVFRGVQAGLGGFFNEPRSYGLEVSLKM
jgi:iron complex outermembrane recepter protein